MTEASGRRGLRTGKRPDLEVPGTTILHVLVGSRAHGTADEDSDRDERCVFVRPTETFFHFDSHGNPKGKDTVWVEDHATQDLTGWELGRFIKLAMNCNPTMLEVLWAPDVNGGQTTEIGRQLREMRHVFLDRERVHDSFVGYSNNQRKKMLEQPEVAWTRRNWKFAEAYLRVLYQGVWLLTYDELPVDLTDDDHHEMLDTLKLVKRGEVSAGAVIDHARRLVVDLEAAYQRCTRTRTENSLCELNSWLGQVRRELW